MIPKKIWIVISTELGKWSNTPMAMESDMFTKEQAIKYAQELQGKYKGDFYVVGVDTTNKEKVMKEQKFKLGQTVYYLYMGSRGLEVLSGRVKEAKINERGSIHYVIHEKLIHEDRLSHTREETINKAIEKLKEML